MSLLQGKITEVFARESDYHISYEPNHVFTIEKNETTKGKLIANSLGKYVAVQTDDTNKVVAANIGGVPVLRR